MVWGVGFPNMWYESLEVSYMVSAGFIQFWSLLMFVRCRMDCYACL